MEPVKHAKSVNFHSNVELPEKYNPESDEGTTNLFKPSCFLHRSSMVFSAKKSVSPEKTHITPPTTKTNA